MPAKVRKASINALGRMSGDQPLCQEREYFSKYPAGVESGQPPNPCPPGEPYEV